VAFRSREEEDAQALGADEIDGAGDMNGLGWLLPMKRLLCQRDEEIVVIGKLLFRGQRLGVAIHRERER
jgi:hypothetical protein